MNTINFEKFDKLRWLIALEEFRVLVGVVFNNALENHSRSQDRSEKKILTDFAKVFSKYSGIPISELGIYKTVMFCELSSHLPQ